MSSKDDTLLDKLYNSIGPTLMNLPLWVGPVLSLVIYVLLGVLIPTLIKTYFKDTWLSLLGPTIQFLCLFLMAAILVVWMFSQLKRLMQKSLLESLTDLESLKRLSWRQFELLVSEAYRRRGFYVEETPDGPDGGVDLVMYANGEKYLVQCKHWKKWQVGVKVVRELYGVMAAEKAEIGVVVTTGRFTNDAIQFAKGKPIHLRDGAALMEIVREVQEESAKSTPPSTQEEQPISASMSTQATPVSLVPAPSSNQPPLCPQCGNPMVKRQAKKGDRVGKFFYGCSRFPNCMGIINIDD